MWSSLVSCDGLKQKHQRKPVEAYQQMLSCVPMVRSNQAASRYIQSSPQQILAVYVLIRVDRYRDATGDDKI